MAKTVILRDPEDNKVWTWHDAIIDSVHSHTLIYTKRGNILNIAETREAIKFNSYSSVSIYFKSGFYIQVFR